MREIKFRSFSKKVKGMVLTEYATFLKDDELNVYDDCELMQFTGLLDKNGVDIYEGDVVDYDFELGAITYENIMASFCFGGNQFDIAEAKYMKVIGNIYEHPHLLEVKDE